MLKESQLPVPYFCIDSCLCIRSVSEPASELFAKADHLSELLDEGSLRKAESFISPDHSDMRVELILRTRTSPFELFDVYQRWDDDGRGHLVCIRQDGNFRHVSERLHHLQEEITRPALLQAGTEHARDARTATPRSGNRNMRSALETIGDLVDLLYPSLVEINKADIAEIIKDQIEGALTGVPSSVTRLDSASLKAEAERLRPS